MRFMQNRSSEMKKKKYDIQQVKNLGVTKAKIKAGRNTAVKRRISERKR